MAFNGSPFTNSNIVLDETVENLGKAQDYAKEHSGVPVEAREKIEARKKRQNFKIVLLILVLIVLFVLTYLLPRLLL